MNEYKFINSESLAKSITDLLKAEMGKINILPDVLEYELTDEWLKNHVDECLQNANEVMDMILDAAYDPYDASFFRIDIDYNKHIRGIEERDDAQFKDLVKRIREEDHHAQTKSDLEFINAWYLENFAKDNIVNPFVRQVKEWQEDWA